MATIIERKRKDGTTGYTAQIVLKQGGKRVHSEAKTFDRKQIARSWALRREVELSMPGGLDRAKQQADKVTLGQAIQRMIDETVKPLGRTKLQVLKTVQASTLGDVVCADLGSDDIVAFARDMLATRKPQTVQTYLSHLGSVFTIARPAWKIPLDPQTMKDARIVGRSLGMIEESHKRDRRPTMDELGRLMRFFVDRSDRRPDVIPMHQAVAFAIFSTRRLDEICRQRLSDYEPGHGRMMVRDMKHPGQKVGNNVWCDLPDPAMAVLAALPSRGDRLFPFNASAVGAAFTRACQFLEIEDLHFHDLRHDGISRLFEMGLDIPHVAAVSGHRSWASLKRYTHIRQAGDKYAGWEWLRVVS